MHRSTGPRCRGLFRLNPKNTFCSRAVAVRKISKSLGMPGSSVPSCSVTCSKTMDPKSYGRAVSAAAQSTRMREAGRAAQNLRGPVGIGERNLSKGGGDRTSDCTSQPHDWILLRTLKHLHCEQSLGQRLPKPARGSPGAQEEPNRLEPGLLRGSGLAVENSSLAISMFLEMLNESNSVISIGSLEIWVTICIELGVGLVKNGLTTTRPAGAVHSLDLDDHFPVEDHLRAWLAARQRTRHAGYPADRVYISGRTPETQRSQVLPFSFSHRRPRTVGVWRSVWKLLHHRQPTASACTHVWTRARVCGALETREAMLALRARYSKT
jgi:hypothetical protein